MSMFVNVCRAILRNPGVSPLPGLFRHSVWHLVRRMAPLPLKVTLTQKSRLVLTRREEMNGCVALAWSQRLYCYHNMMFLRMLLEAGFARVCFDVGANIGVYSLLMSETETARVYSFEPHPATCATLRRMLESNGRSNASAFQLALSDATGELRFTNDDCSAVNQALELTRGEAGDFILVPCETGRDFCAREGVTPEIIKIDTEGLEARVLNGFGGALRHAKVVMTEMNLAEGEVSAALPAGVFAGPFHVDVMTKKLSRGCRPGEDVLFISRESIPALRDLGFEIALGAE
ncbi:FkbM family methyltransferase [Prosthecobacter sp.]|uniref:FkbM family methyltransferase n=1 Tax=Prosthecobacter sp. TaxID=1965333 RepID=UPI0037830B5F